MDRIVGKIFGLLLFFGVGLHAKISLELTNINGHEIMEAAAGELFLIKLSLDNADAASDMKIDGLKDFFVRKSGYSLMTVNGVQTAQLTYQVRIDAPGVYKIGPAYSPGTKERSNAERLTVEAWQSTRSSSKKNRGNQVKNGQVFLRLWTDKDTLFVGEKNKTVLRLYFSEHDDIAVDQIVANDPKTVQVTERKGPKKGAEELDGKEYLFYEWQWDLYATKAGKLVIPAYFVDYNRELPMQPGLGSLSIFFGPRYERKRAYSNALTLQVRALPDKNREVDAIGSFIAYRAEVQPAVAKKYEGIVLRLSVEGDGNMMQIKEPQLQGVPESFKYYFSKSYIEETTFGQKKSFEYIIQGMKEGDWEIPEQTFSFFDVEGRTYKTLNTAALYISILSGQPVQQQADTCESIAAQHQEDIHAVLLYRSSSQGMNAYIPFGLFILLLLLPIGLLFGYGMLYHSHWIVQRYAPKYIKRGAFKLAHKQLARAYRYHDVSKLHAIFAQLIADRLSVSTTELTREKIDSVILQSSWPDKTKREWSEFYDIITQANYAGNVAPKEVLRLFHDAAQWLAELERIL